MWVRLLLASATGLIALGGCDPLLDHLAGDTGAQHATPDDVAATGRVPGDDDTPDRAVPITPGVYRSGRLETHDDVDYFKVAVTTSGAIIAATDHERAPDATVRIEYDRTSANIVPLEFGADHVQGTLVNVTGSVPATIYIRVSGGAATRYDLAVWVIERRAVPWFFGDGPDPTFDIDIRYVGAGPSAAQQAVIRRAAAVWERVVAEGLPDRFVPSSGVICDPGDPSLFGSHVDDLLVYVKLEKMDGRGGTLAQAGPCWTRLPGHLPYLGIVIFDEDDLRALHAEGALHRIAVHEIGHALGFGIGWHQIAGPDGRPLLQQPSLAADDTVMRGRDTYFSGAQAVAAFDAAGGVAYRGGAKVPVENDTTRYGAGALDAHWRESVFGTELMTSTQVIAPGSREPLSLVTVKALADMGYAVDDSAAEPYRLPAPVSRAAGRRAHAETAATVDLTGDVRPVPAMAENPGTVPRVPGAPE